MKSINHTLFNQMTQTQSTEETKPDKKRKAKSYTPKIGTPQERKYICNQLSYINYNNQVVLKEHVEICKTKLQEIKEGKK